MVPLKFQKRLNMKTGQLIKQYRENAKLTQKELATKLGYEIPQFISLVENGHSSLPLNVLNKVINALNIPKKLMIESLMEQYKREVEQIIKENK